MRGAAKMAVGGSCFVDRTLEVERFDNRGRAEVEKFAQGCGKLMVRHDAGVEGVDQERNRFGDPDRVGHLDFTLRRESGGNDILRDMARHIASRTVDLARVFTRKRAAAVTAVAAVAVDDNLAPGETAVAMRPADDET